MRLSQCSAPAFWTTSNSLADPLGMESRSPTIGVDSLQLETGKDWRAKAWLLTLHDVAEGNVWKEQSHTPIPISLYETRPRRAVEKEVAVLQSVQEKRKEAYARAQDEAIRLAQRAASKGEEDDPAEDFIPAGAYGESGFSKPDRLRVLDRRNRVSRSWNINQRPPTFPKAV